MSSAGADRDGLRGLAAPIALLLVQSFLNGLSRVFTTTAEVWPGADPVDPLQELPPIDRSRQEPALSWTVPREVTGR